jgi:hypothetical protein
MKDANTRRTGDVNTLQTCDIYTVKPHGAILLDKNGADSVTNHFTTPLRVTGFSATTFPRPVKFQWGHKNLLLFA